MDWGKCHKGVKMTFWCPDCSKTMLIGELCLPATVDIVICKLSVAGEVKQLVHTFKPKLGLFPCRPCLRNPSTGSTVLSRLSVAWLGAGTEEY